MAENVKAILEENAHLRERVRELEFDRSRKTGADVSAQDMARDIPNQGIDELNKLFRGVVLASVEQLRVAAEAIQCFTDEVSRRSNIRREAKAQSTAAPDTGERSAPLVEMSANL